MSFGSGSFLRICGLLLFRHAEKAAKRVGVVDGRAQLALPKGRRHPVTMTSNALRKELFQLSVAERLELVEELWDSIAADAERDDRVLPLSDEQKAELDRRIAAHRADPSGVIPWEQVREELRRERS